MRVICVQQVSELNSRSDVDLTATYKFKYSNVKYSGIPIMSSNMGAIGTFEMAKKLSEQGLFTCIRKYYSFDQWKEFLDSQDDVSNIAVCCGLKTDYHDLVDKVLSHRPDINYLCLDIANGGIKLELDDLNYLQ